MDRAAPEPILRISAAVSDSGRSGPEARSTSSMPQFTGRLRRSAAAVLGIAAVALTTVLGSPVGESAEAAPASAHSYYVNCNRAQHGDGTLTHPWNSLRAIDAHAAFEPGDSILLKRGSTCKGQLRPAGSGTARAKITLGAYGTKKKLPTINGGGTPNLSGAVELTDQAYWNVQDLHITNRGSAKETKIYRSGVLIKNNGVGRLRGITVQRLQIDSVVGNLTYYREYGGISVLTISNGSPSTKKNSGFDDLRLVHNRVTKVGRTGIVVSNHGYPTAVDNRVRIAYNKIVRARGDSIILRGSAHGRIDHNVSADGADFWPCAQCGKISPLTANAGIWPASSRSTRIDHNEVYGEHKLGGDGEGLDIDMSALNTVVEYNYIHDNAGGGILFCGSNKTKVRFNVLENNANGQFTFIGSIPARTTSIYNNTVYTSMANGAHVVRTFGGNHGKGIKFYNNLIYNMGWGYYQWPTPPRTTHNTVVGTHGLGEPRGNETIFDTAILRNPGQGGVGFKTLGGYRPASPKLDPRGVAIPKTVTKDFFGNTIDPRRPPRGAALR
jgi:hypothetical protein